VLGAPCPQPGLTCSYADLSGCQRYFSATCSDDGTWEFEDACVPHGGSGGSAGGTGATAGTGGVPCADPVPGPPTVTSPLAVVYPPDGDSYRLELSEAVKDVATALS
jgi:hypothetical protein